MTALPKDVVADLRRRVAELEQQLQSSAAERDEAIAQQAATAEILQIINSSPADLAPVFEAILDRALRPCEAQVGVFWTYDGELMHASAIRGAPPAYVEFLQRGPHRPSHVQLRLLGGTEGFVQIADLTHSDGYRNGDPLPRAAADLGGIRTLLVVPLRRHGAILGTFGIYRQEVKPFTDRQIALVESFAAQAVIAMENARLFNKTKEALERQNAGADILRTIASTPGDAGRSLKQIAETSARLFVAPSVSIQLVEDGKWADAYRLGDSAQRIRAAVPLASIRVGDRNMPGAVAGGNRQIHIPDLDHLDPSMSDWPGLPHARAAGTRTMCGTPLRREGKAIGALIVYRDRLLPFTPEELALAQSFADQAVIAIENARLFNETKEALERQTATAEILKVIASSPSDIQPVFDAIATRAKTLIGGFSSTVFRFIDGIAYLKAFTPTTPAADEILKVTFPRPVADFPPFQMAQAGEVTQVPDTEALSDEILNISRARGFRSMLFAPLMNDGVSIGFIAVTRVQPGAFADHHVQLLRTFADQAVIAIENARLFEEVQAKTRDLSESLRQQTAVGDVLKTISRSTFDLQPVLDTLVHTAARLCDTEMAFIMRREGDVYRPGAAVGYTEAYIEFLKNHPLAVDRGTITGRAVLERRTVQILDVATDPEYRLRESISLAGQRTTLCVPLLRENEPIGTIVLSRQRVEPFTQKQIDLVTTFADQAVIAIENVRLFDQLRQRTDDLSESLQQQTATADVLKVISRSAFDLQAVLDTLVESAARLCEADMAAITRRSGDAYYRAGSYGFPPEFATYIKEIPVQPERRTITGRTLLEGRIVHVSDVLADPEYDFEGHQLSGNPRTFLGVPLLREGIPIGALTLTRSLVKPFTEQQIELIATFADQAVIAIENVRLFDEVQAKTRDLSEALTYQTGSSNILSVIASSPTDVGPVLKAIVESARELCEANDALVVLKDGNDLVFKEQHGSLPVVWRRLPINRNWATGRTVVDGIPVHVHDLLSAEGEEFPEGREIARRDNVRTILTIPLLREQQSIGAIVLRRTEVHPFSDKQIALLQTFADQAVIAIGNVRLFEQVQERTKELSKSLDDLRTAQDRLVQTQKLASLGQLTAGIAHEIKNPLNFVNNFAALSAELTDELNEVLTPTALDGKTREEVFEITHTLKDNLAKVVQHGKRADSIVKNMLLHSREGSGEHRSSDINALLDESLNLAYHGARAEKREFNVTLQRDFDATAGTIEVFPQEITRVFLNLIANGFYAVTKRKTENGSLGFDPVVRATTKNLGDTVEIRIRDNGTGIPAEVKEKMFNPFFTTKPAGEGTGLGLSMSHDIIVKQHGGTIDVETEPGKFTEFRIVLPRTSNLSNKVRG